MRWSMSICKDEGLLIMYIISIEIQHILKDQILLISEAVNLKAECFHAAYQLYCTPKSVDVIYSIQIIIIFFFYETGVPGWDRQMCHEPTEVLNYLLIMYVVCIDLISAGVPGNVEILLTHHTPLF